MIVSTANYRDALDAGSASCYMFGRPWPGASERGSLATFAKRHLENTNGVSQESPGFPAPNEKKLPRIWNNPPQPQNAETKKPQKERGTLD